MMPLVQPAQTVNSLYAPLITQQASQRVTRIRWINDYTVISKDIHSACDQALLRVVRMYFKILTHLWWIKVLSGGGTLIDCGGLSLTIDMHCNKL